MILNRQRRVRVEPAKLESFLARVRRTLGAPDESVSVCLVSDTAIARMNRVYRGEAGPTDVLSFPVNGSDRRERKEREERIRNKHRASRSGNSSSSTSFPSFTSSPSYLGDIAISPETALRNARRFGRSLDRELRVLILHGVLHLVGYDHETDNGEMERLERRLRRRLGVA